jgi:hypothetical protein
MRLEGVLPFMAAVALVASPLLAQETLPATYQGKRTPLAVWTSV